jgi:hypothetical protein
MFHIKLERDFNPPLANRRKSNRDHKPKGPPEESRTDENVSSRDHSISLDSVPNVKCQDFHRGIIRERPGTGDLARESAAVQHRAAAL